METFILSTRSSIYSMDLILGSQCKGPRARVWEWGEVSEGGE